MSLQHILYYPKFVVKMILMDNYQRIHNELYQSLGKLFYAVAAADKVIRDKELIALKKMVTEQWLAVDDVEDEFHSDAAYQIEVVFDWLTAQEKTSNESYEDFHDFYMENANLFSTKIKYLALTTANAIANAFSKKNKNELVILGKLNLLFKLSL